MKYKVIRTDDHGNVVIVRDNCSRVEAEELCSRLTERGHKQTYEVKERNS